jgi:antitoxin YefM
MQVISYSEARNSLKSVLDSVNDNADVTIINRRDAGNAVVMSLDHYNSVMETLYLLQSPANAAHLMESIEQFKAGKATVRQLVKD